MTDSEQIALDTSQKDVEISDKTVVAEPENIVSDSKSETLGEDVEVSDKAPNGDTMDTEGDSEAETLIQSPEKQKQMNMDASATVHQVKATASDAGSLVLTNTSDKENVNRKRKRPRDERNGPPSKSSSRRSSPLSSPVAQIYSEPESEGSGMSMPRPSSKRNHSETDDKLNSPKKRRRRPSEIIPPSPSHKRSKRESIDSSERRETRSATYPRPSDDEKSPEPEPIPRREHRRGVSTQLTSGEFVEKRKRGRPPLINTRRPRSIDHGSDDSDASESRAKSARPGLSKLASHDHDILSPAKPGPRKWKDKVGRTPLARACNDGDLDAVRARYAERPEDLREQDNAKNTPLQIASIEGWDEVVEFLLQRGAEVNVRNIDGDTPLIDAVENGHIPVIKLLLEYGANARAANMKGYEPAELVKKEDETFDEIRSLLSDARQKSSKKNPGADTHDHHNRDGASSRAASAASPRDSPPIGGKSPPAFGNRRRTGRSESTRNDLLYQANTQENLVKLAGKGDVQGVANILSILEKADTESLIAAAKAGHEEVLQLLIAMGRPNPDPEPVRGPKLLSGHNTPMLAAIGRGHPDVVKLLANQSGFNPTRTYKEKAYYELAEERKGDKWQEEVTILKQAYERYKGKKSQSPRKTRDGDRQKTKPVRRSSSANSIARKSSPTTERRRQLIKTKDGLDGDKRKVSDPSLDKPAPSSQEDGSNPVAITSDQDQKSPNPPKTHRTRRSVSDLPPMSPASEPAQRRRRLVTGKEHRSRHTLSNSSDNEMVDAPDVKGEDRKSPDLKRHRRNSTMANSTEHQDRAVSKKRRTLLESSPDDVRSRPVEAQPATTEVVLSTEVEQPTDAEASDVAHAQGTDSVVIKRESPGPNVSVDESTKDVAVLEPDAMPVDSVSEASAEAESEGDYSPPPAGEPSGESEADKAQREKEEADKEEAAKLAAAEAQARQEQEAAEEKRRLAEEESARQAEEQARREKEEAEKRKREEEAERARQQRIAEEEERHRQEAARAAAEQRKLEAEKERISTLPILLARTAEMIDNADSDVRDIKFLRRRYLPLYAVRERDIEATVHRSQSNEQWIPSFQIAGLLATKDLQLVNYQSMTRKPASDWEVKCMWRWARSQLAYEPTHDYWNSAPTQDLEIERQAERKFLAMETPFWVKHSDFLLEASKTPHLQGLDLVVRRSSLLDYTKIFAKKQNELTPSNKLGLTNGIVTAIHTNGIS